MQNENRLKYAAADAEAFHRYAYTAWDSDTDCHLILTDSAANAEGVAEAFSSLSAAGPFDMLLVYLSGHGERDQKLNRGWFCLADAQPSTASLDGSRLQDLLSVCRSERVVLIIDCCYAESLPMGMSFFSSLAGPNPSMRPASSARLYIASARYHQRAWEEDELRRSVFSDVLLRGLSNVSRIMDASGLVDLEARLIPLLRNQVPLQTASHKSGMIQEPISGGVSAVSVKLPTVAMKSLGRELTVSQTVRRRFFQVASGLVVVTVVAILAVDALAYHLTTNAVGHIIVRPGLAATYGILPLHTRRDIDTGVSLADIDAGADDFLAALSRSAVLGMNTHLDQDGLRPWLLQLEKHMTLPQRAASAALVRGEIVELDGEHHPPPLENGKFLAALRDVPLSDLHDQLYDFELGSDVDCAQPGAEQMDFVVLNPSPSVYRQYATWLAATLPVDPATQAKFARTLVGFAAHRGFHADGSRDRLIELRNLAHAVDNLTLSSPIQATGVNSSPTIEELGHLLTFDQTSWCQDYGLLARGLLTSDLELRRAIEEVFVAELVRAYADDPSAPALDDKGELAAVALHELALASPLGEVSMLTLSDLAQAYDLEHPTPGPAIDVLSSVAPFQRLPEKSIEAMLARIESPLIEEFDFLPVDLFRLLASNSKFLEGPAVQRLRNWSLSKSSELYTMSDFHAGLGFLSLADTVEDNPTIEQAQIDLLLNHLSPSSRFAVEAVTYSGTSIIAASGDEAVVALGRVLQSGSRLSPNVVEQLANVAQARRDLEQRSEVIKGLATYWYGSVGLLDIAPAIVGRLVGAADRSLRRTLEAEIAGTYLQSADLPERQYLVTELLQRWGDETEPDVRKALATVIVLAGTKGRSVTPRLFPFERSIRCGQTC